MSEVVQENWKLTGTTRVKELTHDYEQRPKEEKHGNWVYHIFPEGPECPELSRLQFDTGDEQHDWDRRKYVCALSELKKLDECVVLSIGSHNYWELP
eukprot:UN01403